MFHMKMLWSPTTEIFFTATDAANSSTGTNSATNATITNLTLNIAVDQNFITNKMLDNTLSRKLSVMDLALNCQYYKWNIAESNI